MSEAKHAESALASYKKLQGLAMPLAAIGLLVVIGGYFTDRSAGHKMFWASYVYGWFFWMSLTLGCTTLTFLHHSIRAQWSLSLLRIVEAGNKLLPVMALFFLPLVFGVWTQQIYPWADPKISEEVAVIHHKASWLNPTAWTVRSVLYFAYWIFMTSRLNASSTRQDETRDERLGEVRASWAAPGGVLHVVLLTGAMTDWAMSLDPTFFSTIYGVWHMVTQVLCAMAFGTILTLSLRSKAPYVDAVNPLLTKDLGNMMLGFTMLWGYISLSQFIIIWAGNLPEEITFYSNRFQGPLVYVGGALILCQFVIPFLLLLSGRTKREPTLLRGVAIWIFCARIIDLFWQMTPFFRYGMSGAYVLNYAIDLAALAGVGGVWLFAFVNNLKAQPLLPLHDNRIQKTKAELEAHSHA